MAKHSLGRQIFHLKEQLGYDDGDVLHFLNGDDDQIQPLRDCYDDHDVLPIIHGASKIDGGDFLRALLVLSDDGLLLRRDGVELTFDVKFPTIVPI